MIHAEDCVKLKKKGRRTLPGLSGGATSPGRSYRITIQHVLYLHPIHIPQILQDITQLIARQVKIKADKGRKKESSRLHTHQNAGSLSIPLSTATAIGWTRSAPKLSSSDPRTAENMPLPRWQQKSRTWQRVVLDFCWPTSALDVSTEPFEGNWPRPSSVSTCQPVQCLIILMWIQHDTTRKKKHSPLLLA